MNLIKLTLPLIILFLAGISPVSAQTLKHTHKAMHENLLANAKNGLDQNVLQEILKSDILEREAEENGLNTLSAESEAMIADLLSEAKTHRGKRYKYGSKGPNAFDCSGFTSYVYKQFGFSLSPSSRTQFTQGIPVEKSDLRPGDLVFFTNRRTGNVVGHVGIVVSAENETGNFTFIHASTSRGIVIDKYGSDYRGKYLGARRIITD